MQKNTGLLTMAIIHNDLITVTVERAARIPYKYTKSVVSSA